MTEQPRWFREDCDEAGSAFSLQIRGRLHQEQSPYQTIEVFETTHFGNLLVIDDFIQLSARDNFFYHEMMAHPAIYSHANPRRAAIIGGGDCGTLHEVLKHPEIEQVTQIDIDERVTRVCERFFPELCASNDDPRATLLFIDGIRWMEEAPAGALDIIFVDSTDPIGPGEVLFSRDFYAACHAALGEGGIIVQQSESPLLHMDILRPMIEDMRGAGFRDTRTLCFPQPTYPCGLWSATMARKGLPFDGFREEDAAHPPFATQYYTVDTHRGALALPPFVARQLADV